jgi:hypothetical protein
VIDGRLAHVELLCDLVLGATASDSGDDRLPTKSLPVILRLMATSGESGFSVQDIAERSGSGGTRLIGIRWHLALQESIRRSFGWCLNGVEHSAS